MNSIVDEASEIAKLQWCLKGGAAPLPRIYSVMRHLGSPLSKDQIHALVEKRVRSGYLRASEHYLHKGEYFYSIPDAEIEKPEELEDSTATEAIR